MGTGWLGGEGEKIQKKDRKQGEQILGNRKPEKIKEKWGGEVKSYEKSSKEKRNHEKKGRIAEPQRVLTPQQTTLSSTHTHLPPFPPKSLTPP